jgi:hypothetical protein
MSHKVIPILRIFDEAKAREFYIDWLGVDENAPLYMQISKGDIVLHLSEHHGDCCAGAKVFIETSDGLAAYQKWLIEKNYKYGRPGLEESPWNSYTLELHDPFGNKLFFSEDKK